ncbi:MAG: helix-turn-helix transcriptional regulator [Chlorobi bacterium]|nr:helix-turn-helix transcriptional regulator [Chlorobiota bacterium]
MEKLSIEEETVVDNQGIDLKKKIKNIFGHLDPNNPPDICPIRDVLAPVTDKWSILIIIFLGVYTTLRFNELKRHIYGISSKTLTERLKLLKRDGYVLRKMYPEVPIRVEYQLTKFGYQYLEQLLNLTEWINSAMPDIIKKRHKFNVIIKK